jgi:hypothetical protein
MSYLKTLTDQCKELNKVLYRKDLFIAHSDSRSGNLYYLSKRNEHGATVNESSLMTGRELSLYIDGMFWMYGQLTN